MKYPAKEREKQVIAKNKEDMETLAKFYVESESIEEFKINADLGGIHSWHKLTPFYIHYKVMNSALSRDAVFALISSAMTFVITVVTLPLAIFLLSLFSLPFILLLLFPLFLLIVFVIIHQLLCDCFNYAEQYIDTCKCAKHKYVIEL